MPDEVKATPQWQVISAAWDFAASLARWGRSTTAQRAEFDEKLAAAKSALAELVQVGTISSAEAALVVAEGEKVRREVFRGPPREMHVRCYRAMAIIPARESLTRLSQRLPLLKTVAESGRASPAVIEKILPTIREDVERLSSTKQLKSLSPAEQDQARQLAAQARQTLAEIEKACAQ
jgi:hypothetical protein